MPLHIFTPELEPRPGPEPKPEPKPNPKPRRKECGEARSRIADAVQSVKAVTDD